jgi:hypothetical protein
MKKRLLLDSLLAAAILALSVEILLRRWLWQQLPTQLGAGAVYALLAVNAVLVASVVATVKRKLAMPDSVRAQRDG